jgi:hypothetical protein
MAVQILDALNLDLLPTPTYAHRAIVWVPGGDDARDGSLTIRLQPGRRCGGKVEMDTYAVQREPIPAAGWWRFQLANETDPDAAEIYETTIAPAEAGDTCTCKAGQCKQYRCKHEDSLRRLVEYGEFDEAVIDLDF